MIFFIFKKIFLILTHKKLKKYIIKKLNFKKYLLNAFPKGIQNSHFESEQKRQPTQ
jgi:hypothetical protein